jgi:hypothetical protein
MRWAEGSEGVERGSMTRRRRRSGRGRWVRRLDVPATAEEMVWMKVLAGLPAVVAADARNEEKVELSRDQQQEDQGPRRPVVTECESSSTGHFQWLQLCSLHQWMNCAWWWNRLASCRLQGPARLTGQDPRHAVRRVRRTGGWIRVPLTLLSQCGSFGQPRPN